MNTNTMNTNDSKIEVGSRIRQLRCSYGLTQERLSEILGISLNYLGEIERGRRSLSHKVAKRLCAYFRMSLDYIYDGKTAEKEAAATSDGSPKQPEEILTLLSTCSPKEYRLCLLLIRDLLNELRVSDLLEGKEEDKESV